MVKFRIPRKKKKELRKYQKQHVSFDIETGGIWIHGHAYVYGLGIVKFKLNKNNNF